VTRSVSRLRALLVAIAVLALSAGAALAGRSALTMPSASAAGLERAAEAAGKTVPVAGPPAEAAPVVEADEETGQNVDEEEPAGEPAVEEAAEHPDNHGKTVSEAAQATTPDGFDNHGQYVKSVATDNHGQDVAAEHGAQATKGKPER
jgi:hypothetical protein